jgi:hypothetical protein
VYRTRIGLQEMIVNDRGGSGQRPFWVLQVRNLSYPHGARLIACLCEKKVFARSRESLDGVNSISHAELELADHESCIFM